MKKTIVTFGLISGAISSVMMVSTVPFLEKIGDEKAYIIGYTSMVLSFLLVYFGIRSYRDNVSGGHISFGKAFKLGLAITMISCVCYVVTWEILSHTVMTDFVDKYAAHMVEKVRASGASAAEVEKTIQSMKDFKEIYKNPFINVAMTFIEPFPVGLLMTLISAGVLRKRPGTLAVSGQTAS